MFEDSYKSLHKTPSTNQATQIQNHATAMKECADILQCTTFCALSADSMMVEIRANCTNIGYRNVSQEKATFYDNTLYFLLSM